MTSAACFGDVGATDRRSGIAWWKDGRQVAISSVTIDARGRPHPALNSARVKAPIVSCVRVRVKLGAAQIRQSFSGCMASLAIEVWRRGWCRRWSSCRLLSDSTTERPKQRRNQQHKKCRAMLHKKIHTDTSCAFILHKRRPGCES